MSVDHRVMKAARLLAFLAVGAILYFGAVVAPAAFTVLTPDQAGALAVDEDVPGTGLGVLGPSRTPPRRSAVPC